MKTVKDYLDLGLVFVDGDKGYKHIIESFAWRNNDGVKPEYKGLIDVCFEGGTVSHNESSIDFEWSLDDENYIAKWRPVVLQSESDDAQNKLSGEIFSAMASVGFTSKKFCDALIEAYKPKFTIKEESPSRTMTVNIEGRDYLIASRTPTVSPKEDKTMNPSREPKAIFSTESTIFGDRLKDVMGGYEASSLDISAITGKPMKPVYTAEMHAKGELPPVGAECILIVNNDPRPAKVTYIGKDIVCCSNVDGDAEYACLLELVSFKPIAKTINVNGFDVPAPMSEAPEFGSTFYNPIVYMKSFANKSRWSGDDMEILWLSRGLVHAAESAAIAHAKAMLGIDPNA